MIKLLIVRFFRKISWINNIYSLVINNSNINHVFLCDFSEKAFHDFTSNFNYISVSVINANDIQKMQNYETENSLFIIFPGNRIVSNKKNIIRLKVNHLSFISNFFLDKKRSVHLRYIIQ